LVFVPVLFNFGFHASILKHFKANALSGLESRTDPVKGIQQDY
jgi:hypothetical protein